VLEVEPPGAPDAEPPGTPKALRRLLLWRGRPEGLNRALIGPQSGLNRALNKALIGPMAFGS
jgi:hypothetical protein